MAHKKHHPVQPPPPVIDVIEIFEHDPEVVRLLKLAILELRAIRHELAPKPVTAAIAVQFTGDFPMQTNNLVLNVGQTSQASIAAFLADGVSPSGGVASNVAFNFNDPSATVDANGLVTGVAASTAGAVGGTATATITDTDGAVSQWSQPFTILVSSITPPPPDQLTQSVAVQFTDPV